MELKFLEAGWTKALPEKSGIKVYLNYNLVLETDTKAKARQLVDSLFEECDERWVWDSYDLIEKVLR